MVQRDSTDTGSSSCDASTTAVAAFSNRDNGNGDATSHPPPPRQSPPLPQPPPLVDPPSRHPDLVRSQMDLLGVSVHHFRSVFLPDILQHPEFSMQSKFHEIENLRAPNNASSVGSSSDGSSDNNNNNNTTRGCYVRDKGAHHICPVDGRPGAAYVDTLSSSMAPHPEDHCGPSTAMLSWTWQYTVGDVVHTLVEYCREHHYNPKRTYIWMCCLCVNQHRYVPRWTV